jgi:cystathionine beta-lyase
MTSKENHIDTLIQHSGSNFRVGSGLVGAVEKSVTFATPSVEDTPVYSRLGNTQNHLELEKMLSDLHNADEAVAVGSGMSAWTLLFLAVVKPGDHILCQTGCYGGTYNFLTKVLQPWGVETTFAPIHEWEKKITDKTKMVVCESISNPFCIPQDLVLAVSLARKHNLLSVCDNTFASPVLCKPLNLGFDFVMESCTKYLNGHADVIAGMISGSHQKIRLLRSHHAYLGTFLPPDQCMQLLRGIRTLGVRMAAHSKNATIFSDKLSSNPKVQKVYYGMKSQSDVFTQGFGGMLTIRFQSSVPVKKMMRKFKLIKDVPSLGSTESTATMPAFTTNWFMSSAEKSSFGIDEQLVRFSIGLENPEDLVADVIQAIT